jgi:hypothetical protein
MKSEQTTENNEAIEPKVTNPEMQLSRDLFRDTGESQEEYLWRSGELIAKNLPTLTKIETITDENIPEDIRVQVEQIVAQASLENIYTARKKERSEEEWENFKQSIGEHFLGDHSSSEGFDKTVRDRGFFRPNTSGTGSKRESYWNTLFFPLNSKETRALAKKMLDQKKIILLGGGRSELLSELQAHDISPESITNIDPFVENPAKDADKVIAVSASDEAMIEALPLEYKGKIDEVWAEYSVPAYLQSEAQIRQLMTNIDTVLAPKGVARIWPIMVGGVATGDSAPRKEALYRSVRDLVQEKGYHLVTYKAGGRPGMILTKPEKSSDGEKSDEEKIAQIINQIDQL